MSEVEFFSKAAMPTEYGEFVVYAFKEGKMKHLALIKPWRTEPVLARIHSKCLTSETFGSLRCDCKEQLETAMQRIGKESGIIIYLDQEGRGIGLANKIMAYELQDMGFDTVEANLALGFKVDQRDYSAAVEILRYFKIASLKLLTNNPDKVKAVRDAGIAVEQIKVASTPTANNIRYLTTKHERLGHLGVMGLECIGTMRRADEARPKDSIKERQKEIRRNFRPRQFR
jgi:GTP cyclohydrolase II